jgi:beta-fructofuranosidase
VLFYTSVRRPNVAIGRVRRAVPADADWREWIKKDVVADPPPGLPVSVFRDPFVFRDEDTWRMLVGGGMSGGLATTLVYTSADLAAWEYTGRLAERSGDDRDPVWTGTVWECIQLVSLGHAHVFVVSVQDQHELHHVAAAVGTYAEGRFAVSSWHRLTYGPAPYAASTYTDSQGRVGLMAWLRRVNDRQAGWAGALTVPTLLTVDDGGRPRLTPHPAVAHRRAEPCGTAGWPVGAAVDVEWSPRAERATLTVCAEDGASVAEMTLRHRSLTVTVSGRRPADHAMPWSGGDVRLLLDGPVLEVFCDGALLAAAVSPLHRRLGVPRGGADPCRQWILSERPP